jgi:hypothetical protein
MLLKSIVMFMFGLLLIFVSQHVAPYEDMFWNTIGYKPQITIFDFGFFKWTIGLTLQSICLWMGIIFIVLSILRLLIL